MVYLLLQQKHTKENKRDYNYCYKNKTKQKKKKKERKEMNLIQEQTKKKII